jgi:hypothetical protein
VLAAARVVKPMMASALEDAEPVACDGAVLRVRALGGNPMTVEGLNRARASIEAIVARVVGAPLRLVVGEIASGPRSEAAAPAREAAAGGPPAAVTEPVAPPAPAQRVTATGAKAERLKALRQKAPSLDSAMDSLDLELLE